jgi:hypothetical protein
VTLKLTQLFAAKIDTFFAAFSELPNLIFFIFKYFVDPFSLHLLEFFLKISMYRSRDI